MATLPGEPLYRAFGFREVERVDLTLPDGVVVAGVAMVRYISPLYRRRRPSGLTGPPWPGATR
jgi:hypothetical protein